MARSDIVLYASSDILALRATTTGDPTCIHDVTNRANINTDVLNEVGLLSGQLKEGFKVELGVAKQR